MKICTCCGISKAISEFHKSIRATGARASRGGNGVTAWCKVCSAERRKPGIHAERAAKAALQYMGMKTCAKCCINKARSDFHTRKASPDGLSYKCKPCMNTDTEKWREQHPTAHLDWYRENREHKKQYWANWRANNVERVAITYRQWAKANPEKVRALVVKRRAAKLNATPAWANQAAIEAIYAEAARITKLTGERHEVDHIVPLQGRIVRGLHWEGNLQILPKSQNISKHNRYWPDMP